MLGEFQTNLPHKISDGTITTSMTTNGKKPLMRAWCGPTIHLEIVDFLGPLSNRNVKSFGFSVEKWNLL